MIAGQNFFHQRVKNDLKTYANTGKIATGQVDDYTTSCLLDYPYFKEHYKVIAINLSKQQTLDDDLKKIQRINFTGSLARTEGETIYFIIEEAKITNLDFSKGTVRVL